MIITLLDHPMRQSRDRHLDSMGILIIEEKSEQSLSVPEM